MMTDSTPLLGLTNIGPTIARRLSEININTAGDLRSIGPVEVYNRLRARNPGTTLSVCYYLYSLQGALDGMHWDALPAVVKERLRAEANA